MADTKRKRDHHDQRVQICDVHPGTLFSFNSDGRTMLVLGITKRKHHIRGSSSVTVLTYIDGKKIRNTNVYDDWIWIDVIAVPEIAHRHTFTEKGVGPPKKHEGAL